MNEHMTPDRVRYAYAGVWYPRPAWRRWEVLFLSALATVVVIAFVWPVAAYVARQVAA